jgi:hypothetical protein
VRTKRDWKIYFRNSVPLVHLQKKVALLRLVICFSLQLHLNLKFKYKPMTLQKKLKTTRGFLTDPDLSIHAQKDPENLARHSPQTGILKDGFFLKNLLNLAGLW